MCMFGKCDYEFMINQNWFWSTKTDSGIYVWEFLISSVFIFTLNGWFLHSILVFNSLSYKPI